MHRHLSTFKAYLVVAARTGFLSFVTTASGFTQTRSDTATDAAFGVFSAICGFNAIEFHHQSLRAL
jgi:predicted membrane-bound mannosyltransferase